jgi:F0F1-type ATP synthase assembly protein I
MGVAIPLLMQLLPSVLQMFSGRAQAQIAKATGSSPEVAGQFMQTMITKVGDAVGLAVNDNSSAIQAVSALTALSPEERAAKVADLEAHALETLAPVLDRIHGYQKDEWAAEDSSQKEAFERNRSDPTQNIQKPMMSFTMILVGISALFTGGLLVYQMKLTGGAEPNGQIIILFVMLVTSFMNMLRTQNDWSFGSSRQSAAKDATIAQMTKK